MNRLIVFLLLAGCGSAGRPTADPGPLQRTARAGEELTFDASASRGSITRYTWDFNDGKPAVEGKTVKYTYPMDGDFTVTLTVRGPGGAHSASVLVNVGAGCAATARIAVVTQDPQPNMTVVIGSAGSSACMGATLTTYEWDLGDGTMISGDSSRATISHTYATANTYMVKLRVVDSDGNEGRATYALGVGVMTTAKPTITSCAPNRMSAEANQSIQFSVVASDPGGKMMTYEWTFGDGATATGSTVQHAYATTGTFTVSVIATTSDSRVSMPCTRMVMITPPVDYTGTWILSPGNGNFTANCPFSVSFPTASVSVVHVVKTDGGPDELVVTPNGGTYPSGYELRGTEDSPGSFLVSRNTPNENGSGSCNMSLTTQHLIRFNFSSAMDVGGNWTKVYNAGQGSCFCTAGGPTNGTFTGFKQ